MVATGRRLPEELLLLDSSVHAAFAGQALHWFGLDRALPEIGRVLRPGGFVVAMWNSYDDRAGLQSGLATSNGLAARAATRAATGW